MLVAVATPSDGVTRDGDVAKTRTPEPVSSVTAAARFALDGVARNVATPVPNPEIPVLTGKPVAFVRVAAEGVPRSGVVKAGLTARATAPVPVLVVAATPLIRKLFPVPAVSKVLFVNVAVVPAPISVVDPAGSVRTVEPSAPVVGSRVMLPDVALLKSTLPTLVPEIPRLTWLVPSKTKPSVPDNTPDELYCTLVLLPPAAAEPPA